MCQICCLARRRNRRVGASEFGGILVQSGAALAKCSLVIFCAIAMNLAVVEAIVGHYDTSKWAPHVGLAVSLLAFATFSAAQILRLRGGVGSFALEGLQEMTGWAWVAVVEGALVGKGRSSRDTAARAAVFVGALSAGVPLYMLCARAARLWLGVARCVDEKLAEFEVGVGAYVIGFSGNVFFASAVLGFILPRDIGYVVFLVEISLSARIVLWLQEKAAGLDSPDDGASRDGASRDSTRRDGGDTDALRHRRRLAASGIALGERALAVACGFCWLDQYRALYGFIVYGYMGAESDDNSVDDPRDDDADEDAMDDLEWLEPAEGGALTAVQLGRVFAWWALVVAVAVVVHALLTISEGRASGPSSPPGEPSAAGAGEGGGGGAGAKVGGGCGGAEGGVVRGDDAEAPLDPPPADARTTKVTADAKAGAKADAKAVRKAKERSVRNGLYQTALAVAVGFATEKVVGEVRPRRPHTCTLTLT